MRRHSIIVLSLLFLSSVVCKFAQDDEKKEENVDTYDDDSFSPTSEWKPLKKDQAIPRGLHVRVNLATGKREAKLLDPADDEGGEEAASRRLSVVRTEEEEEEEGQDEEAGTPETGDMSELRRIMHKMMEDGLGPSVTASQEAVDKVKSKFRSYAELKKELGKMEMGVKTDAEILRETLSEYQELREEQEEVGEEERSTTQRRDQQLQILTFLEYLVHQIDNGQQFIIKMNGYREVILPALNSSHPPVRNEALRLLASSAQNNPRVQQVLLRQGAVSDILRFLSSDPSSKVKTSAMYALSCLIRGSPAGQSAFLDKGGISILIKQFQSDASEHLKRQVKAVSLVRDMLEEEREAAESQAEACSAHLQSSTERCQQATSRLALYSSLSLSDRLHQENWCQALVRLLVSHPHQDQVVEEMFGEMSLVAKWCSKRYRGLWSPDTGGGSQRESEPVSWRQPAPEQAPPKEEL